MVSYVHEAFDGTDGKNIIIPESLRQQGWVRWIKVLNNHLTLSEVACFLSHISLWVKCIELDQPIVILEHDAIMQNAYLVHTARNAIVYLGSKYQINQMTTNLVLGQINKNYRFMYCAHAYAIDPYIAKNLVSSVIKSGITTSTDAYIRADMFAIVQGDLMYAYDENESQSTIHHPTFGSDEDSSRAYLNMF